MHKIRLRVRFLQELNEKVEGFLKLVDTTLDLGLSFLTDLFISIRPLIFWETKSEIVKNMLDKSESSHSEFEITINRVAATNLVQAKRMDIKLNQSVFCQLCDQLNAKSPSIYRLGKQYMLVNFLKIMVVLVMNVNKLLVKNYKILNFYHYLSNVQIEKAVLVQTVIDMFQIQVQHLLDILNYLNFLVN